MIETKYPNITVQLTGEDGNAFSIMGKVLGALKKEGIATGEFLTEAMSSDYDNLLQTCMKWVTVN
jgi:hypothetical protein